MLELEQAREQILAAITPLSPERIPLRAALGRVVVEPIFSPVDLPVFDNSAMDGYAVRAPDVSSASPEAPAVLQLRGQIAAGEISPTPLQPKTCVRIFTGSCLPSGADAVVMQEDTRVSPDAPSQIQILEGVKLWENIRLRGEDVKRGAALGAVGEALTVGQVSLLAATGVNEVSAGRLPVIGLLATGSELLEPGQPLAPGKIFESNRTTLAALLGRIGISPRIFPLVPDDLPSTRSALAEAFSQCDAVITTGGVSVGELDWVKKAFEELGGKLEFWKVAIRPGKPFVFGRWAEKFLFGLPGNPVSALVTFLMLVRPALLRWQGAAKVDLPAHPGCLIEPLANRGERRHFVRVAVDRSGGVRSTGAQASHILSSLAQANGLVDLPPGKTFPAGTMVEVMRWDL